MIRDLVIDRRPLMRMLREQKLHLQTSRAPGGCVKETPFAASLRQCVECLACVSTCPACGEADGGFLGPFGLLKLAQLHLDPRDEGDRRAQAQAAGIERCADCAKCYCINGLPLRKALESLKQPPSVRKSSEAGENKRLFRRTKTIGENTLGQNKSSWSPETGLGCLPINAAT